MKMKTTSTMTAAGMAAVFALCGFSLGCMSTKIILNSKWTREQKPVYEDYADYYVLGFVGHPEFNLQKICMDQKPYAVQRLKSAEDQTIAVLTLGIYTPATVRVWCGE